MMHPRFRTLVRYADGELDGVHRAAVATHLLRCGQCHRITDDLAGVAGALRVVSDVTAAGDVLQHVVARRVAGARVVLPTAEVAYPPRVRRGFVAAAVVVFAAGLGGLSVWSPERREPLSYSEMGDCMPNEFRALASAASIFVAAACAQEPTGPGIGSAVPSASIEIGSVLEGTWSYRAVTWMANGVRLLDRTETYEVDRVRLDGHLLLRTVGHLRFARSRAGRLWIGDTAFFAADSFRPTRQATYLSAGQILDLTYTQDRVTGFVGLPERRRAVELAIPRDGTIFLGSAFHRPVSFLFLQAVPLNGGWAGWARTVTAGNQPFGQLAFSVVGEGRVQTPAGSFECWRLQSPLPAYRRSDIWVSKQHQWIVKMVTNPDPDIDTKIEFTLVSYSLRSAAR